MMIPLILIGSGFLLLLIGTVITHLSNKKKGLP
jgi:hypothetical protein